ncbi:MAG: hypothetical protein ACP6IS_10880 [Candidatus Asgardarchaeia archaeon]
MADLIVYKSKVQEMAKAKGFKVSEKFYEAFDKAVKELLEKAMKRAEAEGKKTLMDRHV